MFVVVVEFNIRPSHCEAFLHRVRQQANDSLEKEPDCHVFEVCASLDDKPLVLLYEEYSDKAAFDTHLQSDHFLAFDLDVKEWIEKKTVRFFDR